MLLTACAGSTSSADWRVLEREKDFVLAHSSGQSHKIKTVGGRPEFRRQRQLTGGLLLVIYYAGVAGTSQLVAVERALVLDRENLALLGDYPYRYSTETGPTTEQPQWCFEGRSLRVRDPSFGMDERLALPGRHSRDYCLDIVRSDNQRGIHSCSDVSWPEEPPEPPQGAAFSAEKAWRTEWKNGPNFACSARLIERGCGTGCVSGVVFDAATGVWHALEFSVHRDLGQDIPLLTYTPESSCLDATGWLNEVQKGTFEYCWTGYAMEATSVKLHDF